MSILRQYAAKYKYARRAKSSIPHRSQQIDAFSTLTFFSLTLLHLKMHTLGLVPIYSLPISHCGYGLGYVPPQSSTEEP